MAISFVIWGCVPRLCALKRKDNFHTLWKQFVPFAATPHSSIICVFSMSYAAVENWLRVPGHSSSWGKRQFALCNFEVVSPGTISSEANLGHVLFDVSCAIQSLETCIAVTKVFINLNVSVLQITEQHDQLNGYKQSYSTDLSSTDVFPRSSHKNQAD